MDQTLVCNEISVLDWSVYEGEFLAGFFHFSRYDRKLLNYESLRDCHTYMMRPVERVGGQPGIAGLPSLEAFQDRLTELIDAFLHPDLSLYLHIKAIDRGYFDEISVLTGTIKPLGVDYILLPPVGSTVLPDDFGNLIFECPLSFVPHVVRNWFCCPFIEIDGYVMKKGEVGRLAECYFRPYSVETIRRVLSIMPLTFRLWPDFNGIYLFSEHAELVPRILSSLKDVTLSSSTT